MKTITAVVAAAGYLTAWPVCAGQAVDEAMQRASLAPALPGSGSVDAGRLPGEAASYSLPLNGHSSVFGYIGLPGEPALGPSVSYLYRLSGIDDPDLMRASYWLNSNGSGSTVFTAGYAWRAFKLEGAAFSGKAHGDRNPPETDKLRLDSTSTRLSYSPSPDWSFQFSRGNVSGLDQLEPNEEIRRVTISATYNRALSNGNWQSTLAWGRNARKSSEPTMGYLLESTLRVGGTHAVFGCLEQVGGGTQEPENGTARSQAFKRNRLTLGYFHEIGAHGPVRLDAGAFVSRYFVPPSPATTYGSGTTSFMLFVRLNMQ